MKILSIFILLFNFVNNIYSQSGWIRQYGIPKSSPNSVFFINHDTGFVAGSNGIIQKTINGGLNWFIVEDETNLNIRQIYFPSENNGYAIGDSGLIIKTTNGGDKWIRQMSGTENMLRTLDFVNNNTGYITSIYQLLKTTNGGNHWEIQNNIDSITDYSYVDFINPNTGWVYTDKGLYKSTNSGVNWDFQYLNKFGYDMLTMFFISDSIGYISYSAVAISNSLLYKTVNGGTNWKLSTEVPNAMVSIFFYNNNYGWYSGAQDQIYYTSNGGSKWTRQNVPISSFIIFSSSYFVDSLTGWVVGGGIILKTTTGGVLTGFSSTTTEIPDKYFLSQNYPNPFNPKTIINYELGIRNFVSLKVYNVLGLEVETLVYESIPAGKYQIEFDGSNYPSGVYLYRLEIDGNIVDTKRMGLLK